MSLESVKEWDNVGTVSGLSEYIEFGQSVLDLAFVEKSIFFHLFECH